MQLTSENQQKLEIVVLVYSIRLSFLYLIRGVCKGFFFFSCLYTALLNVAKKKRNFDIGEEHKQRNRRHEETKKKKTTTRKKQRRRDGEKNHDKKKNEEKEKEKEKKKREKKRRRRR
jgi:hypothetical protein